MGWDRAQVVGPDEVEEGVGELREVVVEPLADLPGEEGERLDEPLDVRIARLADLEG